MYTNPRHATATKSQTTGGILRLGPGWEAAEKTMRRYAAPELNFASDENAPKPEDRAIVSQGTKMRRVTKSRLCLGIIKKMANKIKTGATMSGCSVIRRI
jgi:hypothetical protein